MKRNIESRKISGCFWTGRGKYHMMSQGDDWLLLWESWSQQLVTLFQINAWSRFIFSVCIYYKLPFLSHCFLSQSCSFWGHVMCYWEYSVYWTKTHRLYSVLCCMTNKKKKADDENRRYALHFPSFLPCAASSLPIGSHRTLKSHFSNLSQRRAWKDPTRNCHLYSV